MANNIWEQFDKEFDTSSLKEDVKNSKSGSYKEVPEGTYEVSIEKLELVASKAGKPMVTCWMKVLSDGEYKGSLIFMNQVIDEGFKIHTVNEFLRALESGQNVEFQSYKQYGNLLMDIHEAISGNLEYALKYGKNKKGFPFFEIKEVFEVE